MPTSYHYGVISQFWDQNGGPNMVLDKLRQPESTLTPSRPPAPGKPRAARLASPDSSRLTRDRDHQRRQRDTGGNAADDVRPFPAVAQCGPFGRVGVRILRPEEALARFAHRHE